MDTKLASEFWEDDAILELGAEEKLAALWLMTNSRLKLCGFCDFSAKMFPAHTDLKIEALERTIQALPKTFVRVGKGVWIRNFIRRQFGSGKSLASNNMSRNIAKEIDRLGNDELRGLIALEYPELGPVLFAVSSSKLEPLPKPLPRAKSRVEKSREEEGVGETTATAGGADSEFPGFAPSPSHFNPEATEICDEAKKNGPEKKEGAAGGMTLADQKRRFAALFGRAPGAAWSYIEERTLSDIQPIAAADLRLIEFRYGREEEEGDPRRRKLLTLLENLPGEIDAARAQFKRLGGDSGSTTAPMEPEGWREILEKKYRRPEDTEWVAPETFWKLPQSVRDEITGEINQQRNDT